MRQRHMQARAAGALSPGLGIAVACIARACQLLAYGLNACFLSGEWI